MADAGASTGAVALLHNRRGFPTAGGLTTLMQLLCAELQRRGQTPQWAAGLWPSLPQQLVVLGCSSPWAMLQLLRRRHSAPVWVPCFHPPAHVRHRLKAALARWAIRAAQRIGIRVAVLSQAEQQQLQAGRCTVISLPFERTAASERAGLAATSSAPQRPIDLMFLGRPTRQKGWPLFVELSQRGPWSSQALVAHAPEQHPPASLQLICGASDREVSNALRRSKVLVLPADYESFGFAQAEALAMGCVVPVLGEWPLWLDVPELDWRGLDAAEVAARLAPLLHSTPHWQRLRDLQRRAWLQRPERQQATWLW